MAVSFQKRVGTPTLSVRLEYRAPYDWPAMLGYLQARSIPGVEAVGADSEGRRTYRRTFAVGECAGVVEVSDDPQRRRLEVALRPRGATAPQESVALALLAARVGHLFDVEADVAAIGGYLARDPLLAPLVAARPGLRAPGAWDPFELAVRAILGQQVTLAAARRLAGRLVELCGGVPGDAIGDAIGDQAGLTQVFPSAERLLATDLSALGMPAARCAALVALAEAAVADPELLSPRVPAAEAAARLRSVRGIGEWTAQYVALRAFRHADAFPPGDAALLRAVEALCGSRPTALQLARRAAAWSPWRAYAAQHLWSAAGEPIRRPRGSSP